MCTGTKQLPTGRGVMPRTMVVNLTPTIFGRACAATLTWAMFIAMKIAALRGSITHPTNSKYGPSSVFDVFARLSTLELSLRYENRDYSAPTPSIGERRKDERYRATVELKYR